MALNSLLTGAAGLGEALIHTFHKGPLLSHAKQIKKTRLTGAKALISTLKLPLLTGMGWPMGRPRKSTGCTGLTFIPSGMRPREGKKDEVQARRASGGQRIPEAGEAEAGEMGFVARGELGHAKMPEREGEPGVEENAAS